MLSLSKLKSTFLLAASVLLCAAPMAAADKPAKTHKPAVAAPAARTAHSKSSAPSSTAAKSAVATRRSSRSAAVKSTTSKAGAAKSGTALKSASSRKGHKAKLQAVTSKKPRGQQSIDQARTTEIQQALIREHYLSGEATGEWDQATRDALTRFQSDNHWQTKILPDSRALIKLGLGPSQEGLLNPESAAIAAPLQSQGSEKSFSGSSN